MKKKIAIEYKGELYDSWWSLFYDLEQAGQLPKEIDTADEYPLEKYILQEIMKLDAKERPVK
jgi:hypothetical protein